MPTPSSPRRTLADGTDVTRERLYRDPGGALCATARLHARWPGALGGLVAWVAELELESGHRVTRVDLRRPIGEGGRLDARVRLSAPPGNHEPRKGSPAGPTP